MESKRIKFALFTCVFALYGCVSTSSASREESIYTANIKENTSADVLHTVPLVAAESSDMEALAFRAAVEEQDHASMFLRVRDAKGVLQAKADVKKVSQQLGKKVQEERKRLAEEKKKQELKEREAKGEIFSPRITTYGVDCYGCNVNGGRGGTAAGVTLDMYHGVQMPDGSFQPGIKYGKYYIVAADPNIPMCSILKISNHGLSGSGITPEEPYYAIVLDRGGAIYGNHIDLYIGSENSAAIVPVQNTTPQAEIIRRGGKSGGSCSL